MKQGARVGVTLKGPSDASWRGSREPVLSARHWWWGVADFRKTSDPPFLPHL